MKLKVRLYNKRTKEFIYREIKPKRLDYANEIKLADTFWSNTQKFNQQSPTEDGDEWKMSVFTGLLDKQGKEIYEGDFVKCYNPLGGVKEWTAKIIFEYGGFYMDNKLLRKSSLQIPRSPFVVEVIGNIYKNPDLIRRIN